MANNYNDIPTGLRVPASVPQDVKMWIKNANDLIDLGPNNSLAFTYYKGLRVYAAVEREVYEWMEIREGGGKNFTALLPSHFVYPMGYSVNGIDYGGESYNFYLIPQAEDIVIPPSPVLVDVEGNNVGNKVELYKDYSDFPGERYLNFRTIETENSDNVTFTATQNADTVKLKVDVEFPDFDGIKSFYVNSAGSDTTGTGSIMKPFKTWDRCKEEIIGDPGTYSPSNPQHINARVVFQTNTESEKSLSIKSLIIHFENDCSFRYIPPLLAQNSYAIDTNDIHGGVANHHSIKLSGQGRLMSTNNSRAIYVEGSPNGVNSDIRCKVSVIAGSNITIEEYFTQDRFGDHGDSLPVRFYKSDTIPGVNQELRSSGDRPIYGISDSEANSMFGEPANSEPSYGLITLVNRNFPVAESFSVDPGATLTIRCNIQCPLFIRNATLVAYGNLLFLFANEKFGVQATRYNTAHSDTLSPSMYLPQIFLDSEYRAPGDTSGVDPTSHSSRILVSSTGGISGYFLGSLLHGGFKSILELKGYNSGFEVTSTNPMSWSRVIPTRYFATFTGNDGGPSNPHGKRINIFDSYILTDPISKIIFQGNSDYKDIKIGMDRGILERFSPPSGSTIKNSTFGGNLQETSVNFSSKGLTVLSVPKYNNLPGSDTGLIKGQLYVSAGSLMVTS